MVLETGDGETSEKRYGINQSNASYVLESNFFSWDANKNLTVKDILQNKNLSDVIVVNADRKITYPKIPLQMQMTTKLPMPSDISTTSQSDLMYM